MKYIVFLIILQFAVTHAYCQIDDRNDSTFLKGLQLFNDLKENHKIIYLIKTTGDPISLPVGVVDIVDGIEVMTIVTDTYFKSTGAYITAYITYIDPITGQRLFFYGKEIRVHNKKGFAPGSYFEMAGELIIWPSQNGILHNEDGRYFLQREGMGFVGAH